MRGVDEVGSVPLWSALEAQLAVCGDRVVEKSDAVGQLSVVKNFSMILTESLAGLSVELELVLVAGPQSVHGAHLVRVERLAEQVDGGHLAAEQPVLHQHNSNIYVGDYLSYGGRFIFC